MGWIRSLGMAVLAAVGASCTVVSVQSQDDPVGLRADGLVDGHAVLGWRDEKQAVRVDLFDGQSRGAIAEVVLWKIARLEVGLAGLAVGLGPVDLALGVLFYDPRLPVKSSPKSPKRSSEPKPAPAAETAPEETAQPGVCDEPDCTVHSPSSEEN